MKMSIWLIPVCSTIMFTNYFHKIFAKNQPDNIMTSAQITQPQNIKFTKVTLLAREETRPPIGQPPIPNRDIGFASVFIRLENAVEDNSKILIQGIEIVNVTDNQFQSFTFSPQEILLKPLENSEEVFHLKNKTGYMGQDKVRAVITYQIDNQVSFTTSEPVEINRL
jgi:hypothetical protein